MIVPVLIWALVGWLTGYLMRGRGYGALYNVLLGVGGGVLGSLIFRLFNLQGIGDLWLIGNVIVGVAGALVLIYGVRLFSSNKAFGK
ncbi:MAG: GlsB/YeaQ/YmgE family stress response membrane protein [Anaerolineae bacterium]|nr:GlsB/YeaQ/YmgE family stress response membrane protein [Anaerolineae bacterium]